MPTNQAHLSVRHALVNLCGLQVRHEIDDTYPLINEVPMDAELDHTWRKYLLSSAESVKYPIAEFQIGTALPLESDHLAQLRSRNSAPLSQVQMDCGHWAERSLFPSRIAAYESEGACPKCGNLRTAVRLWPER